MIPNETTLQKQTSGEISLPINTNTHLNMKKSELRVLVEAIKRAGFDTNWFNNLRGKSENVAIIGPAGAGKTHLLLGIYRAYSLVAEELKAAGVEIEIKARNNATANLWKMASTVLKQGQAPIPVNQPGKIILYQFSVTIREPGSSEHFTQNYDIPDGAGGALFPSPNYDDPMWQAAENAESIIFCLDPENEDLDSNYFDFAEAITFNDNLSWKNGIFLCTKADQYFSKSTKCSPQRAAESADPTAFVESVIGKPARVQLFKKIEQLSAVWVSFYGFLEDGSANYVEETGRLKVHKDDADGHTFTEADDAWWPFQMLAPILYNATGRAMGVCEMQKD